MAIRSVDAPRRQWPVWLLIGSVLSAALLAASGASPAVLAAAVVWVVSSGLLTHLVGRADDGARVRPAVLRGAVLGSLTSGLLLFALAGQVGQSLLLLVVALGFLVGVLLLGGWLLLAGIGNPPAWLRDAQGRALPARRRLGVALRHLARQLRQRPLRSPRRILDRTSRDVNRMVWRAGTQRASAFSHIAVVLHPDTLAKLDAWLPVQHLAFELAQSYAEARRALPSRGNHIVVHLAADPAVPLGVAGVAGSLREPRLQAPVAKAWARLHGLPDERGLDGGYRYPAAPAEPAAPAAPLATHGGDPDRTQVLAVADGATVTLAALPGAPALQLRPCGPDGEPDPSSAGYELAGPGPWSIGRHPQSDVRSAEEHVSRLHAQVAKLDGGWGIVDCSSGGTTVNGRRLAKGLPEPIRSGDIIELGQGFPRRVLLRVG